MGQGPGGSTHAPAAAPAARPPAREGVASMRPRSDAAPPSRQRCGSAGPSSVRLRLAAAGDQAPLMAVVTAANCVLRAVPRVWTVTMRKAAIRATIRPYSTIVAPSSAATNERAADGSLDI